MYVMALEASDRLFDINMSMYVCISRPTVTAVKRSGPKCSVVSVHVPFILENDANKTTNEENNREAHRAIVPLTKITTHTERREKGLPKYDSQSETELDSCP